MKLKDKKREIFTAQFDRYDFERRFKRIYFNNVKNDKGELIKERFWISDLKGKEYFKYRRDKSGTAKISAAVARWMSAPSLNALTSAASPERCAMIRSSICE